MLELYSILFNFFLSDIIFISFLPSFLMLFGLGILVKSKQNTLLDDPHEMSPSNRNNVWYWWRWFHLFNFRGFCGESTSNQSTYKFSLFYVNRVLENTLRNIHKFLHSMFYAVWIIAFESLNSKNVWIFSGVSLEPYLCGISKCSEEYILMFVFQLDSLGRL